MISMALWVLESEIEIEIEDAFEFVVEGDVVEMQEKCLSADERQSTIRQSGGGDVGVDWSKDQAEWPKQGL